MKTHVFCLAGAYLTIVDIKDKSNPSFVSSLFIEDSILADLAVSGSRCYVVSTDTERLYRINVRNLSNPFIENVMNNGDDGIDLTGADAIVAYGDYVYINGTTNAAATGGFLQILEITNPTAPVVRARMNYTWVGLTHDLKVKYYPDLGRPYLFVAAQFNGNDGVVFAVDVGDPDNPLQEAWAAGVAFAFSGLWCDIAGNFLYWVEAGQDWQQCLDITDPTVRVVLSSLRNNPPSLGIGIACQENYAYIIRDLGVNSELWSIDYTNHAAPANIDIVTNGDEGGLVGLDNPDHALVENDSIFVAAHDSDCLEILKISDPTTIIHEGRINNGDDGAQLGGVSRIDLAEFTLIANFIGVPIEGIGPTSVQFTDLSVSTLPITSWLWDFGDGETSAEQNPLHTYTKPGKHTVSLTVE